MRKIKRNKSKINSIRGTKPRHTKEVVWTRS